MTGTGDIACKRIYRKCRVCQTPGYPVDEPLGITSGDTVGLCCLAVMAGTSWSFDQATEHLEEFCGNQLSDNTIRDLCQKEAVPMGFWERKVQSAE